MPAEEASRQEFPKSAETKDEAEPKSEEQAPSFPILLEQFSGTMEAVLEVLKTVSPHVASLDAPGEITFKLPAPSEQGLRVLEKAFGRVEGLSLEQKGEAEAHGEGLSNPDQNDDAKNPEAQASSKPMNAAELSKTFVEAYKEDFVALRALAKSLKQVAIRPRREDLLHGSLLAMTVGTLETAIAGVATQHFVLHPGALPSEEKEFSLAELAEFDDLRDARDLAISKRVEDLMRGGFEGWDNWFNQLLERGFGELADDKESLHEAIQRRHLVVHSAGRVSRQYKSKVSACKEEVGAELPIDRAYLEEAIDRVTIFGARLVLVAWAKWKPVDRPKVAHAANDLVFSYLRDERWGPASCIAKTGKEIATAEQARLYLQVNGWQAEVKLEGLEAVRSQIETWDISALSPEYAAAKAALLEDYESLFELLPPLYEQKLVKAEELREWPLFEGARRQERWAKIEELLPEVEEMKASMSPQARPASSADSANSEDVAPEGP